eukprot:scaffold14713_cov135-Skeletonema_dohrnii-CCMP3373.AAC.1
MRRPSSTTTSTGIRRHSLTESRASSIAVRAFKAESSQQDFDKFWKIIAVIIASIVTVYASAYAVVEFGLFHGNTSAYDAGRSDRVCLESLHDSEFDLIKWDRYEEWFDENTKLELPEVGIYTGPSGIREYVQITVSKYFESDTRYIYGPDVIPLRVASKDECVVLVTFGLKSNMSPEYTRGGLLERGVGAKIYYSAEPFRVSKVHIYYSHQYQDHLFRTFLDNDVVRDDVCSLMEKKCEEMYMYNNLTQQTCREKWDALPISEEGFRIDGNSKGCRIVHASMAALNEKHCPHISFLPVEDLNGKVKCQTSGMRSPEDVFTQWELDKIRETAAEHGLPQDEMFEEFEYQTDGFKNDDEEYSLGVTGSFFTSNASDESYMVFYGFILWATIVLTGIGMEFFCFSLLIKDAWDLNTENRWRFVQFLFPLLASTAVGMAHSNNFWALPLITITLYKFGFPETILYLYSGLFDKSMNAGNRWKEVLEGIGTVIHHSSAALYITMVLVQIIPSTRSTVEVVIPVLVQHWFVLLRYRYRYVYVVVEILLELWFEWTVLSSLEVVHKKHWVSGIVATSMLVSHWLYFIAGGLGLYFEKSDTAQSDDPALRRLKTVRNLNAFGDLDEHFNDEESEAQTGSE